MRSLKPLVILAVLLPAMALPALAAGPASGFADPAHGSLLTAHGSSGRGLVFGFELLTENQQVEANVSDPEAVSASMIVVVRNNATAPLSVRLSASINLGGKVTLDPAQTPLLLYQATTNVIVSVTLPEATTSDSMGYLQIEGVCDQNPTVTNMLQIRITIKQWHRVSMERFSMSSTSPLEREMVTLNARVINAGNGPSRFQASALVDGRPLKLKIDGYPSTNYTVDIGPGRFFMLAATWQAAYGHHNFVVEVRDIGKEGEINSSEVMSKDTKMVSVFVGYNYRDLIPFLYVTIIILAAAALIGYKYRRKLAPRLRRLWRRLRRLPPEEGDVDYEEDGDYEDDEYDDEEYDDEHEDDGSDDEEYEDEGEEDDEGEDEGTPPPKKAAAARPKGPAAPVKRAPAPKASPSTGKGAVKTAARPASRPAPKAPAEAGPGVIVVGASDESE
jgi:hypothetical protein